MEDFEGIGKLIAELRDDFKNLGSFSELLGKYALRGETQIIYWQGLGKLISHPWFSRIWIYQEVITSSKTRLIFGDKSMP